MAKDVQSPPSRKCTRFVREACEIISARKPKQSEKLRHLEKHAVEIPLQALSLYYTRNLGGGRRVEEGRETRAGRKTELSDSKQLSPSERNNR